MAKLCMFLLFVWLGATNINGLSLNLTLLVKIPRDVPESCLHNPKCNLKIGEARLSMLIFQVLNKKFNVISAQSVKERRNQTGAGMMSIFMHSEADLTLPTFIARWKRSLLAHFSSAAMMVDSHMGFMVNSKLIRQSWRYMWWHVYQPGLWLLVSVTVTACWLFSLKLRSSRLSSFGDLCLQFALMTFSLSFSARLWNFQIRTEVVPFNTMEELVSLLSTGKIKMVWINHGALNLYLKNLDRGTREKVTAALIENPPVMASSFPTAIGELLSDPSRFAYYEYKQLKLAAESCNDCRVVLQRDLPDYISMRLIFMKKDLPWKERNRINLAFLWIHETGFTSIMERHRSSHRNENPRKSAHNLAAEHLKELRNAYLSGVIVGSILIWVEVARGRRFAK